jgi:hypothetical protein
MKTQTLKIVLNNFFTGEKIFKKVQLENKSTKITDADELVNRICAENPDCFLAIYDRENLIVAARPKSMIEELKSQKMLGPLEAIEFMNKWKIDILTLEQKIPDLSLPEDDSLFDESRVKRTIQKIQSPQRRGRPQKPHRAESENQSKFAQTFSI